MLPDPAPRPRLGVLRLAFGGITGVVLHREGIDQRISIRFTVSGPQVGTDRRICLPRRKNSLPRRETSLPPPKKFPARQRQGMCRKSPEIRHQGSAEPPAPRRIRKNSLPNSLPAGKRSSKKRRCLVVMPLAAAAIAIGVSHFTLLGRERAVCADIHPAPDPLCWRHRKPSRL